eukprot:11547124-Karenia_brevis.AAC.1
MEVKRARMGQDRPEMNLEAQIPQRTSEDLGALWRTVGGSRSLRISRIRRKKEKEEGGTRSENPDHALPH